VALAGAAAGVCGAGVACGSAHATAAIDTPAREKKKRRARRGLMKELLIEGFAN
jgi:hypothetical protein